MSKSKKFNIAKGELKEKKIKWKKQNSPKISTYLPKNLSHQIADIFTKGLPRTFFYDFWAGLNIREPAASQIISLPSSAASSAASSHQVSFDFFFSFSFDLLPFSFSFDLTCWSERLLGQWIFHLMNSCWLLSSYHHRRGGCTCRRSDA
jgi:hypothetical protein